MDLPESQLSHHTFPTTEDIINHESLGAIRERRLNSITDNALAFPDFLESTSTWNQNHVVAFRMLDFNDLPIDLLYPQLYYPSIDDAVIAEVKTLFTLSKEDIREGRVSRIKTGPAFSFYRTLQDCLRTQQKTPSPTQVPTRPQRSSLRHIPTHQYTASESSGSSFVPSLTSVDPGLEDSVSEDKSETVINVLLITYLYLLADLENEGRQTPRTGRVLFSANHDHFAVTVAGKPCGSENDGAAWRSRWSQSARQWVKSGRIPLCSLECKRLDHGRSKFQILAQEGGELLAIQQLKYSHGQILSKRDEEAYLICCHHTSLFITSAVVDTKFFESVTRGRLSDDQFFIIKHSVSFDLADKKGILDASRAVIGLLRYLLDR